jgi:hypothetical protein
MSRKILPAINKGNDGYTGPAEMFYFDPNNITADDWRRLGLTERLTKPFFIILTREAVSDMRRTLRKYMAFRRLNMRGYCPLYDFQNRRKIFIITPGIPKKDHSLRIV